MLPDWWRRGVVYQVYPRSFADSDGDGVGDLAGIAAHLDHLNDGTADSLGVDALWLSPIYPSPGFDGGYDVADFVGVDPGFGTLADFDRLVAEAHRRGIAVLLDLVMNHSSHLHRWFADSRTGRDGPYADWYIWRDAAGWTRRGRPRPPNDWQSFFGGPAWTWEPARGQFYLHTFLPQQPDLNWRHGALRAAMLDVVRFWLARGVDGFRLDVFNCFFRHPDLPDNPRRRFGGLRAWDRQVHVHDKDQPEMAGLLAEFRALVDAAPGRMSVGEPFAADARVAAGYAAPRHLIFDFGLLGQPWRADRLARAIEGTEATFGPHGWPALALSNHDQPRAATRLSRGHERDAVARAAAMLLLTLRGTPFLYYGEEIALGDVRVPRREMVDRVAERYWPLPVWWNRDPCRAPMPWSAGAGGGFTTGRPWMRMAPDTATRNVAAQASDPASVLVFHRRLLALRRASTALQTGTFRWVVAGERGVLAYLREVPGERMLVALTTEARRGEVSLAGIPGRPRLLLSSADSLEADAVRDGDLHLRPREALLIRLD